MHPALLDLVLEGQGVVHRATALERVPARTFDHAGSSGSLARVLPSTYVLPDLVHDRLTLRRAGLEYAGQASALSHLSALRMHGLPVPEADPEHVSVPLGRRVRAGGIVLFHRRARWRPGDTQTRQGVRVVRLERAVVESWPLLSGDERRAPAIIAVQRRLTTPARLRSAAADLPNLPGRDELMRLLTLLDDGCQSQLEIWGYLDVFTHPDLPRSRGQVPVRLRTRTIYLDRLFEAEQVDVELDGRKYHSSPIDRERDTRRDVELSSRGVVVLRFSHNRTRHEPDQVRAEIRRVLAVRRRQLGLDGPAR